MTSSDGTGIFISSVRENWRCADRTLVEFLRENFGLAGSGLAQHNIQKNAPARPEHLRCALAELRTTFIKLGQILSIRADLWPPEYLAEVSELQNAAPSVPFEAVRNVLISEFAQPKLI